MIIGGRKRMGSEVIFHFRFNIGRKKPRGLANKMKDKK